MVYISTYDSPVGKITLASKDDKLIGLWIEGQKHFLSSLKGEEYEVKETRTILNTKKWLERYFLKENPSIDDLNIKFLGTEFSIKVWKILYRIPYGEVTTYKRIAEEVAKEMGITRMSCQAVGGAVGRNPISIIVPCHRVVGSNGDLTGYAGGVDKKIFFLELEGIEIKNNKVKLSK